MQYHHPTPRALIKPRMVISLGLTLLVPAVSFAADLTAEQIMMRVSQTYCGLTSFRFVENQQGDVSEANPALPGAGPPPFWSCCYETDLAVSAPGEIRLVVSNGNARILLVSDGRKSWAYIPDLGEYIEAAAAPLLAELWAHPVNLIGDDLARYRALSDEAGRAKLRRGDTLSVGGHKVRCYVVSFPAPTGSRRLWVDEQSFLVLRDEWDFGSGFGPSIYEPYAPVMRVSPGDWTSRLMRADLGPLPDDIFQFVVPRGARRVDSFTALGWTLQRAEEELASSLTGLVDLSGTEARAFALASLGGENVRLDQLRGKIVVLNFWASWCKPCQEELAVIQKLHQEFASKGVVFLGIDEENPETVKSFVQAGGYTFPMLLDSKQTVHGLYGVRLAPTTVVIDRKGKITGHLIGAASEAQLRQALTAAGLDTGKP